MGTKAPLITVRVSKDAGEAELIFSPEFHRQNIRFKADVVGDLLAQSQTMYDEYMRYLYPPPRPRAVK